jgi:DNA-binding beta-propeller fold protein YncE
MIYQYVGAINATTVAGQNGVAGSWSYQFNTPTSVTFDEYGNMYIMDSGNNRIQRWWPGSTYGVTVASGSLYNPRGLAFDPSGNLATADYSYHRVVSFAIACRKYRYIDIHFSQRK